MAEKYIYLKMTKEWGGFRIGEVVRFGENKGRGRIKNGEGVEVAKPKVREKPKTETAVAIPAAETAENPPDIPKEKKKVKGKERGLYRPPPPK